MDGKIPKAMQLASEVMPEMVFEQARSSGYAMPPENSVLTPETQTLIYLGVALATGNKSCTESLMNKAKTQGIAKEKILEAFKIARFAESARVVNNAEIVFERLK